MFTSTILTNALNQCRPLCRNLGSRVHFMVKAILIDFQKEKYMQVEENDVFLQF